MNGGKGMIYMKAAVAGIRPATPKAPGTGPAGLNFSTWHASLRGHNDWGSSTWHAEISPGRTAVSLLYADTPFACRKAA